MRGGRGRVDQVKHWREQHPHPVVLEAAESVTRSAWVYVCSDVASFATTQAAAASVTRPPRTESGAASSPRG